jgi:hypothetical protein
MRTGRGTPESQRRGREGDTEKKEKRPEAASKNWGRAVF